jgi:hypothetical protein
VTGIDPDLLVVVRTQMTTIDVDHHAAIVRVVMDTVTEALPDEATMMIEADMIALLLELEDLSMIIRHPLVVGTMNHTVGIILHQLIHT